MKIAIGCDPNATEYKKILTPFVEEMGHEVVDLENFYDIGGD